jgi:hypothetical protein
LIEVVPVIGKHSWYLLAILVLIAARLLVHAQTARPVSLPPATKDSVRNPALRLPITIRPGKPLPPPIAPHFPIRTPGNSFHDLARASGTIFSGTVTRIERRPANHAQALTSVAITLHVEGAIRGVRQGEDFTLFEWAGLWSSGQRYRIGERVLLFLYPASKLGLTSCVAGPIGRFAVDAWGRVLLSAQHLSAFRTDPVLGGKSRLGFSDFALAVRHASEEE